MQLPFRRTRADLIIRVASAEKSSNADWGGKAYTFVPASYLSKALPLKPGDELLLIRKAK